MLKRGISIALVFVFLLITAGLNIHVHYCGGSIAEVDFFDFSNSCPCEEEMPMASNMGCCTNDQVFIKFDKTTTSVHYLNNTVRVVEQVLPDSFSRLAILNPQEPDQVNQIFLDSSPPIHKPPLVIVLNQLTYYG